MLNTNESHKIMVSEYLDAVRKNQAKSTSSDIQERIKKYEKEVINNIFKF